MGIKKWVLRKYDKESASNLCKENGYSGALAVLLAGRGIIDPQEANAFITCEDAFNDPYSFTDMEIAAQRTEEAIENNEKIAVYGDYDADGVTATALLYTYLSSRGADVIYYIPTREGEGYGLHKESVDILKNQGVSLIITVDNGISAIEEAEYIQSVGIDIIITDHHMPGDILPKAIAVVNPHRYDCYSEFKYYSGVGVAFKFVQAIEGGDPQSLLYEYADLVTIGTIGDVVNLSGENRAIIKYGIELISNTKRPGIKALLDISGMTGRKLTSQNIAYSIVPRINAAGRMGSPDRAVRLLITENMDEAMHIAREIDEDNKTRQKIEQDILIQAQKQLQDNPDMIYDRIIVLSGENWHRGVTGIVAARICEKYGRPAIMISIEDNDAKGSGRSIQGFSLYDALNACSDDLIKFGGHMLAAGLNIETTKIDEFRKNINNYAASWSEDMPVQELMLDFKIKPAAVNLDTIDDIEMLEPFGSGNPAPIFGLFSMHIESIQPLSAGKHLRIMLSRAGIRICALKFNSNIEVFPYTVGDIVDIAITLDKNEYKGEKSLTIVIKDIRPSGFDEEQYIKGYRNYEALRRWDDNCKSILSDIIPDRNELASVYRYLRASNGWNWGINILFHKLNGTMNMCKLLVCLDVLSEMGIIEYNLNNDTANIKINKMDNKVNLDDSQILTKLKSGEKAW